VANNGVLHTWLRYILPGLSLSGTLAWGSAFALLYAWYSGCETGLYRVNRLRLHLATRDKDRRALRLDRLLEDPQLLIGVLVVGANVSAYLIASITTAYMTRAGYSPAETEFWTTVILTPVFAVFCETLPKNLFLVQANPLILRSGAFLEISTFLMRITGIIFLLKFFSQLVHHFSRYLGRPVERAAEWDNLGLLLREGLAAGPLSRIQGDIAKRLLQLPQVPLSRVLIPLPQTLALPLEISRAEFIRRIRRHPYSRIPLYEVSPRNLVGIVSIYQVLTAEGDRPPRDFLHLVPRIPAEESLILALQVLRDHSVRLAAVVNRDGHVIGIVTLRDLLEEILVNLD
jgi:putative hemolysin